METLEQRLASVRQKIETAAFKAGRLASEITLVAVSKTHPAEAVREAWSLGQRVFGENRVQEAKQKIPDSPSAAHWHLIGHLQKNKVRQALPLFELIHGVDSVELAQQIQRVAEEEGLRPRILLEVNVAGESTKFGFKPESLKTQIEALMTMDRLEIEGLMGMAPFSPEPENARPCFEALRHLRDHLEKTMNTQLPVLSMGMSGDYEVAIEEGSTMVRVGTAIFGSRPSPTKI